MKVKITQELVRETSNLLVTNMYWMIAFKTLVFDVSLFEEMPNRRNASLTPELY